MKKYYLLILSSIICTLSACHSHDDSKLPTGFVYLKNVDPSILQNMRYDSLNNMIGRPLKGYEYGTCILTKQTADALKKAQAELKQSNYTLMVYDCYRPQDATNDLLAWSKDSSTKMKNRFYPHIDKSNIFSDNYISDTSSHSRGSAVDLTIVPIPTPHPETYIRGEVLEPCTDPYLKRFQDSSVDMGTGFDCLDPNSNSSSKNVSIVAYHHRMILKEIMEKYGFDPLDNEWWHFTLKNEPYPNTYFNFPVN
jgi:D-alanyl-D-alanine dipeptidase